jgi:uncharacterized delta-60 repeat protein
MSNFTKLMTQAAAGVGGLDLDHYWLGYFGTSSKDEGSSIAVDSEGNIVTLSRTDSIGSASVLVTKRDPSGDLVWTNTFYGSTYDLPIGVAIDSNDNIIVCGRTRNWGAGGYDILVIKLNSDGDKQWARVYGGGANEAINGGVTVDSSDNVIVAVGTVSTGAGSEDILVVKWNSSGTFQWAKTRGASSIDTAWDVAVDSSDNIFVTGSSASAGAGSYDIYTCKFTSSGGASSNILLGGGAQDHGYAIAIDSNDNVYVVGHTASDGAGNDDFVIVKYSNNLSVSWKRTLGLGSSNRGYGVAIDSEDNVIVSGFTGNDNEGSFDLLIAKYNSSGTIQWQRMVGGTYEDAIITSNNVAVDQNDNIIFVGYTGEGGGSNNTFIMKIPPDGSGTGTYGNFVYKTTSHTDDAAVLTTTYPSSTTSNAGLTEGAATPNETTSTFTTDTFYDITT